MTTDVALAEREAEEARQAATDAESDLATGRRKISAGRLHEVLDRVRHSELTAQAARDKAEQDRQAARLGGLAEIGKQVDGLAVAAPGELPDALRAVAAACARVRELAAAHDATVAELVAAASTLRAEPMAPGGPRKTSAFVAVQGDTIVHKRTQAGPVGDRVSRALGFALGGDLDEAIAAVRTVTERPEPHRAVHHFRGPNGRVHTFDNLTPGLQAQVLAGALVPLSETEIQRFMEGTLG